MKIISSKIFHLAECPLWNADEQTLYWTDILNGEIWKYKPQEGMPELVWKGDMQVGGFAFDQNNNLILCSDKGVFRLYISEFKSLNPELLFKIDFEKGERFNDITTDPVGRIFAGTKSVDNKNGKLYLLEKDKRPEIVLEGIGISNGMTFSLDQNDFYHTDSAVCTITRYDYHATTGGIKNPNIFYKGEPSEGFPDGITLDAEGFLWVAFWGASCVRRLDPDGKIVREFKIPAIQPSSLTFGGESLQTLFVTSACEGGVNTKKGLDQKGRFLGGHVYQIKTEVKGRDEWLACL